MTEQATARRRVLVISHDTVGERMAGPGIRYAQLARVLAAEFAVTLAAPSPSQPPPQAGPALDFLTYAAPDDGALLAAVAAADALFVPALLAGALAARLTRPTPLAVDCYDPHLVETLAVASDEPRAMLAALSRAYLAGDFFVCAGERQRDWLLGLLEAHGRLNPYTHRDDRSLRRLVDSVPFGLPAEPPKAHGPVVRGVWPGIGADDLLILWGGGLWPWLDPLTAVRAMSLVAAQLPAARLIFPGAAHPNPAMAGAGETAAAVRAAAAELGLLGRSVFFGDWLPWADWPGVLLESDIALTLHPDTVEARLAYRSRLLDTIWASLPVVAAAGDAASELVQAHGLGEVVPPGDAPATAAALLRLAATPRAAFAGAFAGARSALTWERAARPLVEFCRQPRLAPDRLALGDRLGNAHYLAEQDALRARSEHFEDESFRWHGATVLREQERDYWRGAAEQLGQERDQARWQAETTGAERDHWRDLAHSYERGRFMRLMRWLRTRRGARIR